MEQTRYNESPAVVALAAQVRELIRHPEVEGETTLEEWIAAGDGDVDPQDIADEWDDLTEQAG